MIVGRVGYHGGAPHPGGAEEDDTMGSNTDDMKGRLKEATGDLTGDEKLKREGKADQAGAKVKQAAEKVKDKIGDAVDGLKDRASDRR